MFKHAHSKPSINIVSLGLFEIVVAVQSTFRLEMHQNDIFYFKKIIFEINTSKRSEKIKNIYIFSKNKIKFEGTRFQPHY
jgi:hypothetical protein